MKNSRIILFLLIAIMIAWNFATLRAHGQTFVYANDNVNGPNTVAAFSVGSNGTLTAITGSPFLTGGTGTACATVGCLNGPTNIATSKNNFLFVANLGSNDVSVFAINPADGDLSLVQGSPFQTGTTGPTDGISLAVTPDGNFLVAGNSALNVASVFSIATNGALTPVSGSPFALGGQPLGSKITPNGAFLTSAMNAQVGEFGIASSGALAVVSGSPFVVTDSLKGIDVTCSGTLLYASGFSTGNTTSVDVFAVAQNGALTPISGSPFQPGVGSGSSAALLSPDNTFLFVSDPLGNAVEVFSVATNGVLALVPGSPFPVGPSGTNPYGLATDQTGAFLFVAYDGSGESIAAFSVAANGSLTPVSGSPFADADPGAFLLNSIVAYPTATCAMPATTTTSLSSSPNPSDLGQTVTLTATVAASGPVIPTGSITFLDGTSSLGSVPFLINPQASLNTSTLTAGTHSLTARYSGDVNFPASTSPAVTQTVNIAPTVTTASLPFGVIGTAYDQTLQVTGGTVPFTWTISLGSLPPGLSLSTAGVISGTPTTAGTFSFTVSVSDTNAITATKVLSIVIVAPPTVTTASLPAGVTGTAYNPTLQATGGTTPYTWSLASGTLPPGLSLSAAGVISGTPTTAGTSSFTVSVKDANALTATKALSIVVVAPLTVTTASLPAGVISTPYSQTLQGAGGTTPYTWSLASGTLPAGLSLRAAGVISGTPTTAGTSGFAVSVKDANALTATKTLSIVVVSQLAVTTASLPGGAIGTAYSQTLQAAGGTAPYTWSLASGTLPPGLSLSAAGLIGGTPTTTGTSSFTVGVKDANALTAIQALNIAVISQPTVTTASLPAGAIGTTYSQTLQAAGGTTPYTWSLASGSLPAGLNLSAAGLISGAPTTAGTSSFTVTVKDANALTATNALSILVVSQLTVTTASLPAVVIGTAYSQALQAAGGTAPYTWSLASGTLPAGLSLSAAGMISGTPTTAGTSSFTVSVKDAAALTATNALTIVVVSRLTVTTTSLPGGATGTAYSQALQASGGTAPYTWSVASGALPAGLSLSAAGAISGTPTTAGNSSFTVSVKDTNSFTATNTLTIVVVSQLSVTTASLPVVVIGTAYGQTLQAAGGTAPYSWSLTSGSLPGGLSLSAAGAISGTPTTAGTSSFTVSVKDANALTATQVLSIVVIPPLTVTTTGLLGGEVRAAYSQTLQAAGGAVPYTWSIVSGSLPAGLSLSAAGAISGTPTTAGTSSFTVSVKDANALTASQALSIVVVPQLTVTTTSLPAGVIGTAYNQTLQAAGGTVPYTWSLATGIPPPGLSLSAAGVITGTPTTAGTYNGTVMVTDANAIVSTSGLLSIVVAAPPNAPTCTPPSVQSTSTNSLSVTATSNCSDTQSAITSTTIDWGDGSSPLSGITGSHTYAAAGTFSITVSATNANNLTNSASGSVTITAPLTTTVTQGQAAQQTANVTAPLGVPSVQVTYKCSGANGPSGPQTLAFYHLSCNINGQGATAMVTLTSTPTPITVTVQTDSSSTAGVMQPGLRTRGSAGVLYAAVLMAPGIVLAGIGRFSKRRRRLSQFIGLALLGMLMWSLLACGGGGGGGSSPSPPPQQQTTTPPGGYTVTGTGTSSGGSSSTITVGFTVNIGG